MKYWVLQNSLLLPVLNFENHGLLNITFLEVLWPRLLLYVPPCLLEEVLKVVAADGDTGLGTLAHVVDGLPYLSRTHPVSKTVDGGPQLSHGGRRIPSARQFGKVIARFEKNGSIHKQNNGSPTRSGRPSTTLASALRPALPPEAITLSTSLRRQGGTLRSSLGHNSKWIYVTIKPI